MTDIADLAFRVDTRDLARARDELNRFQQAGDSAERSAERVGDGARKTRSSFDSLRAAALGLNGVIAGLGFALAGISFGKMTSDALDAARQLKQSSDALGVSAQSLQEWQSVAKKTGVESEKMRDIFKDVSDKIGDFALTGGGEAKDLFEALKLNIKEFKDLAPDKAIEKIGEALNKSGLSRSQKIFLLEGLADDASLLLPKLENITAELAAVRAAGEKTGSIMSQADLDILNEANGRIDELKNSWLGLSNNIGVAAAVLLNTFAPYLQAGIEWVAGLFNSLGAALPTALQYLSEIGASIAPIMDYLTDFSAGVAAIVAGALGLSAVSAAFGLITSAVSALGAALLANPITASIALIAGAANLIYQNWEPIKAWWSDFWSVFEAPAAQAFEEIKTAISDSAVGQAVRDLWAKVPDDVKIALDDVVSSVEQTFEHVQSVISDKGLIDGGIQLFQELNLKILESVSDLASELQTRWDDVYNTLESNGTLDFLADTWEAVSDAILVIVDDLISGLSYAWNDISSGFESAFSDIGGILDEVSKTIAVWADWLSSSSMSGVKEYFVQTWDLIKGTVVDAWELITTIISTSWGFAVGLITTGLQLLRGDWDGAWTTMKSTLGGFYDGVVNIITSLINLFSNFANRVSGILSGVWNGLQSLVGIEGEVQKTASTMQELSFGKMADDVASVGVAAKSTGDSLQSSIAALGNGAQAAVQFAEQQRLVRNVQEDVRKHVEGLTEAHNKSITPITNAGTSLAKTGDAAKKAGDAAKGAAGGHKGLSDAQKEAKKAADDLARAQERIADLFTKATQQNDVLTLKLTQGADAARALELQYQTMHNGVKILTDVKAAELVQMENANKALETEIKKREDAAKAVEKASEAVTKSGDAMQIAKDAIYANDEALRILTLSHEDGYSKAAAATQAHNETLTESYKNQREVVQDLAKINSEMASLDAQLAALKSGGLAAMQAEETQQAAINDLKEKGIGVETALAQQYISAKAAIEAKTNALKIEQELQKDSKTLESLTAEINATKLGSAAVAEANIQRDIRNKLDQLGISQESTLGQRIADTTRQLAAKNKELQITQKLYELAQDNEWLQKEIEATKKGEKALKELNVQKELYAELSRLGIKAGTDAAVQLENQIRQQQRLRGELELTQKAVEQYSGIGKAIADGLMSGNWKDAGKNILSELKGTFVDPLKKSLSDAISQGLAGGSGGGLFASLSKMLNFEGIKGALGGVGNSIGGLFSGIASSAANGFAGIGTAISGGLSGIMGSFGKLVAAIPGWGWALAGVAGLAKLFGGPSAPKIRLTQGAKDGQGMLTDGQQHYTQTAFGTVGATDASYKIGREKDFVPKLHEWFKWVESFDAMVAKTLPNSIASISEALKGVEMSGGNLEGFTRQRLHTIFSALPEALQAAIQGGKNIMDGTTEEIAARFTYMAQVAESGLIPALTQLGMTSGQSQESVLSLAMGLADAAGGIDALKGSLDAYYNAAYTAQERDLLAKQQGQIQLDAFNQTYKLVGDASIKNIAGLRAFIDAQDAMTDVGKKAIADALKLVDAAVKAGGGTADDLAKANQDAADAANDAATATQAVADASRQTAISMEDAARKAEELRQKIFNLQDSIAGLVTKLYGVSTPTQTDPSNPVDNSAAALEAARSVLDDLRQRYDDERTRIDDLNQQARDAYEQQLDYYRTLKNAAENLRDVARGFSDDAQDAATTLKAAQLDYNQTLAAAQAGDANAASKLGDMADRLKSALSISYNGDNRAVTAIQQIESQLRTTAGLLDAKAGTEPIAPADIGSTVLASLEQQIKSQEALINSLQAAQNAASSASSSATAAADRQAMARELAVKIGELGLATDKSAWDILAQNGINIKDLAADFGINVKQLDATFVARTADLASRLNVNSLQLLDKLGVSVKDLAADFGINVKQLDATFVARTADLAGRLNVNSLQLLDKLGVSVQELAKSFGLDTSKINQTFLTQLDALADQLQVSSVDLAGKLGVNIDRLGDVMANKLASLPGIPDNIKTGLAPYLTAIRAAADPATLQKELQSLQGYVNTLPPGIKDQLNAQLQGILGYTGTTSGKTTSIDSATAASRSLLSAIEAHFIETRAYMRDAMTRDGLALILQNARSLNNNAANIGKAAIPSFAVGSDKLPRDMLANVHSGEMIFTAKQSDSVRDSVAYLLNYIPSLLSHINSSLVSVNAANDNQAPVFIQPVINAPHLVNSNSGRDEVLEELRGLRQDNKELKKELADFKRESASYNYAIANSTDKTRRSLEKWDVDGLPLERTA